MKIAIVGAGFCGLAVAWHLLQLPYLPSHLHIDLIDSKEIGKGTSGIAAGLLHPFVGAHAKLNWKGHEGFNSTKELLRVASMTLKESVTANDQGILRLAITPEQISNFQLCAERNPEDTQWLEPEQCQKLAPGINFVPGLWIKTGLTVYSQLYLKGLWLACSQRGVVFKQQLIHSLTELNKYDYTIVTTGAETLQIQELASLPIRVVKGQALEFSWPRHLAPLSCVLNSHIYLLMSKSRTSCILGATYEKEDRTASIHPEVAIKELFPKAIEIFPPLKTASLINCYAGLRAVAFHHRPLIYCLSPTHWVLTGMGSKGLLYHSLFAKELVQKIFG